MNVALRRATPGLLLAGCLTALLAMPAAPALAQPFACIAAGGTIWVLDTGSDTVVDSISSPGFLGTVGFAPDGSVAYVANRDANRVLARRAARARAPFRESENMII